MSITEKKSISRVEVIGDFRHLIVETKNTFLRDGVEIEGAAQYHRESINCGDVAKATEMGVRDYADLAWTPEIIDAYAQHQAALADLNAQGNG